MARKLPFQATTATGNAFDFEFSLHPETVDPLHVSNLISALLQTLDHEISIRGDVGNGDVLQALAMTLAVRVRMLGDGAGRIDRLAEELLTTALAADVSPSPGNHDPNAPHSVH